MPRQPAEFALFVGLLLIGELFPITIQRKDAKDLITVSGPFALALLLRWPLEFVLIAQATASLIDGAVHRISWWARAFNVSQYIVSLAGAGFVFHALASSISPTGFTAMHFAAALAAAAVFFVLNNTLTGIGIAFSESLPVRDLLLDDLGFQLSTNGALIALAPILLVVADRNVLLMLLLPIPLIAIYRAATVTIEKDHQSRHDLLTGLANRTQFEEMGIEAVSDARSRGQSTAVLMVDISNFNDVNDTLGHDVGDELLKQVAGRLAGALEKPNLVSRFGGDQFAILLPKLDSPFRATELTEQLMDRFERSFVIDASPFELEASAGLAVFPQHGDDVGALLRHAEIALEQAKKHRSRWDVYKPENNPYTWRRLALAADIRKAIVASELTLLYQPIADLSSGQTVAVEALVRWPHREFGLVAPDEFVALAERTGAIRHLTEYVLNVALRQASEWRADGIELAVAVNISSHDLTNELPKRIATLLAIWGVPSHSLVLELTETAFMSDPVSSARIVEELKGMNVRLTIDDFGTGYSSLGYLKRLPVDEIKIDRSFVSHMASDSSDETIVRSTIDLARNMGLSVVGEGIDSRHVWEMLVAMGCNRGQGYLIGMPSNPEELQTVLRDGVPFDIGPPVPRLVTTTDDDVHAEVRLA